MEHADFYTVATTVVTFFLVGGIFVVGRMLRPEVSTWLRIALYATIVFSACAVIMISLAILSGDYRDTETWRGWVSGFVLAEMIAGILGLTGQVFGVVSPEEDSSSEDWS